MTHSQPRSFKIFSFILEILLLSIWYPFSLNMMRGFFFLICTFFPFTLLIFFSYFCKMSLLLLREISFLFHLFLPKSHFHYTVARRQMIKSPSHSSLSTTLSGFCGLTSVASEEEKKEKWLPALWWPPISFPLEFPVFPLHSLFLGNGLSLFYW